MNNIKVHQELTGSKEDILFSVIIPTCHRNDLLENCLNSLAPGEQKLSFRSYEIIVGDDGLHSTAEELVKRSFSWARWVQSARRGPASNRNKAAEKALGRFLVFTDDDCIPDSGWLLALQKAIDNAPEVKVIEGRTYPDSQQRSLYQTAPINLNGNRLYSCNLCIEKEIFKKMGGFDEDFVFSYEDMEFAHRLRLQRIPCLFVKEAGVCHPWREERSGVWKSNMRQSIGILTFIRKHPEVLYSYNSFFFLKEIPAFLWRTLPKLFAYRFRGGRTLLVHSSHYLYMAIKLFIPTISFLLNNKIPASSRK